MTYRRNAGNFTWLLLLVILSLVSGQAPDLLNTNTTSVPQPVTSTTYLDPRVCGAFAYIRRILDSQAAGGDVSMTSSCERLCQAGIAPEVCRCRYAVNPCTTYQCPLGTGCTMEMCSDFPLPVCVPWSILYQSMVANPTTICSLPADRGTCPGGAYTRYFYDPAISTCRRFAYSGCGGNSNSFTTLDRCLQVCATSRPRPVQADPTCRRCGTDPRLQQPQVVMPQ